MVALFIAILNICDVIINDKFNNFKNSAIIIITDFKWRYNYEKHISSKTW